MNITNLIVDHNESQSKLSGPMGLYFDGDLAASMCIYYRSVYQETSSDDVISKVINSGNDWSNAVGESIEDMIVDFIGKVFPDIPPVKIYTGTPLENTVYLCVAYIKEDFIENKATFINGDDTIEIDSPNSTEIVGLYTVGSGYVFPHISNFPKLASLGENDVIKRVLFSQ